MMQTSKLNFRKTDLTKKSRIARSFIYFTALLCFNLLTEYTYYKCDMSTYSRNVQINCNADRYSLSVYVLSKTRLSVNKTKLSVVCRLISGDKS